MAAITVGSSVRSLVHNPLRQHFTAASPRRLHPCKPRAATAGAGASGRGTSSRLHAISVTSPPRSQTVAPSGNEWTTTLHFHGTVAKPNLKISVIGAQSGKETPAVDLNKFQRTTWQQDEEKTPDAYTGTISVPKDIGLPGALLLEKYKGPLNGLFSRLPDRVYIEEVEMKQGDVTLFFPCHSWVDVTQGQRIFFEGSATLPATTPEGLKERRAKELANLRGDGQPAARRSGADRIYQYDIYNDLGTEAQPRNNLGGSQELPYPRRLRTGRPLNPAKPGQQPTESGATLFWVPIDDLFDLTKSIGFVGTGIGSALLLVRQQLEQLRADGGSFAKEDFESFSDVYTVMYGKSALGKNQSREELLRRLAHMRKEERDILLKVIGITEQQYEAAAAGDVQTTEDIGSKLDDLTDKYNGLLNYPVPLVADGREDAWRTDEEYGRQFLAGQNPFTIQAITPDLLAISDGTMKPELIEGMLEGHTVAELAAQADTEPRLFLVNYATTLHEYADKVNALKRPNLFQYAGRLVLYRRNDGALVPVCIELGSSGTGYTQYTPKQDHANVWLLAKTIFATLDSGVHQLISHFLRTHAVMEPFQIATARTLSVMHPVYKLIWPHYRYTENINALARKLLINAGGVIEQLFTPGPLAMQISSEVYKDWKFEEQGLAADLLSRGVAKKGANGEVEVIVPDFPYADDGLLIWNSIVKYFGEYLALYYPSDKDVLADAELMAWWDEIKTQAHPDKAASDWPQLAGVADLTQILATIAWIPSGHHSAVNFGQYDYAAYPLNRSPMCRKPIPAQGTPEYEALTNPATFESAFLQYIVPPKEAALLATTVKLLSTHAHDEQYIDSDNTLIFDKKARAVHDNFIADLAQVAKTIDQRNDNKASPIRHDPAGVPYTLLEPHSPDGLTGRGVPYSVSI